MLSDKAKDAIEKLFNNNELFFEDTDPEFNDIFYNFAFDESMEYSILSDKQQMLVILSSLITNQSLNQYKAMLEGAYNMGVTPVEIKELLYQLTAYVGMAKVYDFINETNYFFDEIGISIVQPGQSTTTDKTRYEEGLKIQYRYFGENAINEMIENTPDNQKHFNKFLSDYCFGDFYTRGGLDDKMRELITFSSILSLGGCENQLRAHTQANITVGNTKDELISVVTVLVPYIGFPRSLNALAIINEICK